MQLYTVRGGTKQELENKQYTVGVGISLGNKWFTVDNIVKEVEWALKYTKDYVIVYVADYIHSINIEVRNRTTQEKSQKIADQMGNEIINKIQIELNNKFSSEELKKIMLVKWVEFIDDSYKNKLKFVYSFYKNNFVFKSTIHSLVRKFVSFEDRHFRDGQINRLGDYIIEEIPEHLNRIKVRGISCDAYMYPTDGEFTQMIERIQKGEIFPEIKENIIDTEPKVFLEVR